MSLDPDAFRAVMGRFATGVTVVTAVDSAGSARGMTVTAFASVSLHPPLVAMFIDKTASMYDTLYRGEYFAVNILSAAQESVARRFAATGAQQFEGIGFSSGENGAPLLDGALAHVECSRLSSAEAGDHAVIVGETLSASVSDARPLLYYRGGFAQLER